MKVRIPVLLLLALSSVSVAHHSFNATFDPGQVIEIEGQVTRVIWRNPHVRFSVRIAENDAVWNVETHSVSILSRMDVTSSILEVGDSIKIAGNPSRKADSKIFALNVLLASGEEVVLDPRQTRRWEEQSIESLEYWAKPDSDGSDGSGIFRVWSTVLADPDSFPLFPHGFVPTFDIASYSLTESAKRSLAAFDPYTDTPTLGCDPKGMPTIMEQPYPIEFVDQDDHILLRLEEYDTVRTIHLASAPSNAGSARSLLGHSVGRWEDETLVVTTDRISWPHFDTVGVPLSSAAEVTEWFTVVDDGKRLNYRIQVTDPENFTAPMIFEKYRLAVPGTTVEPYECTN